ncbi:type IV secretion system DNA-binding domain-containing protein [Methylocystis sp. WRRC1]|uniref:type IV secretory system conjugative DNA transfer family protein n=1 Tax=Methylocystis sp. WRRC1 TaxID=1732014 RepID=UPI001D1396AF|nr:type IV secretion system DNA-binding domain-containing protein [Methylocystis sp. WRRC1]MCC3246432.1 type IV secretion system DNA-binding domain-containing protein [Methylocystis sp. WRRC1]
MGRPLSAARRTGADITRRHKQTSLRFVTGAAQQRPAENFHRFDDSRAPNSKGRGFEQRVAAPSARVAYNESGKLFRAGDRAQRPAQDTDRRSYQRHEPSTRLRRRPMRTDGSTILGELATGEAVPLLPEDRRRHLYIIGQTGTGKTGLLVNLMRADLEAGAGFCFLDPHGDASKDIAGMTPAERMKDIIYLDPSDPEYTFAYNPLSNVPENERATATANIASAFKNIWSQSWGPRLEFILTNALRLLLDTKDQTLLGLPRLLVDDVYREWLVRRCADPVIRGYWRDRYADYDPRFRNEAISPIENKIGVLLANPYLRAILCQNASTLDISRIMNKGKALIINLSKGGLGTEPAHLLGALLITAFSQAAEARRHTRESERRDFTLYVDEFQNFATDSFASILSEARKWRLSLVAVNQHIAQLPESLQHAVFGNAGTIIAFRVGAQDAPAIAAELGMSSPKPLRETDNFHAWLRLMREGSPREARLIHTLPPPQRGKKFERVLAHVHARHMVPRALVESRINASFPKTPAKRPRHRRKVREPD